MVRAIKTGLWSGLFGLFTVLLFGGQSVLIVGLILGIMAGLLGGANAERATPRDGARDGAISGTVAALLLLLANVVRHMVVDTLVGQTPPSVGSILLSGLLGVVLVLAIGIALGAVHFLRSPISTYATWGILGVIILIYPFIDRAVNLGWLGIVITSLIFILLALGLNIVVGYSGLLDLGYAAFFAIGAYTAAFLSSGHLGEQLHYT